MEKHTALWFWRDFGTPVTAVDYRAKNPKTRTEPATDKSSEDPAKNNNTAAYPSTCPP
jgi:hypothetical protein